MGHGHLWRGRKAISGSADGSSAFYHTLGDFSRRGEVWGTHGGFTFAQTALDPSVYAIAKVREREAPYLVSDPGIDGGGEVVGLTSSHVDDPLLVAGDASRELVGQVLDKRFDSPGHRSPPFTHCGPFVSAGRRSRQNDKSSNILGVGPIGRNKNSPGNSLAD